MASGLLSQRHNHGLPIAICATSLEVNKYHFHNDTFIHFHFLSLTLGLGWDGIDCGDWCRHRSNECSMAHG